MCSREHGHIQTTQFTLKQRGSRKLLIYFDCLFNTPPSPILFRCTVVAPPLLEILIRHFPSSPALPRQVVSPDCSIQAYKREHNLSPMHVVCSGQFGHEPEQDHNHSIYSITKLQSLDRIRIHRFWTSKRLPERGNKYKSHPWEIFHSRLACIKARPWQRPLWWRRRRKRRRERCPRARSRRRRGSRSSAAGCCRRS